MDFNKRRQSIVANVTNGVDGTYNYYLEMTGYKKLGLQFILSGTMTAKIYGSLQSDVTDPTDATYEDITEDTFGVASITSSDILIDNAEKLAPYVFLKIEVVVNTGDDTGDWKIYSVQLY